MKILSRIKGNKVLLNGGMFSIFSFINQGISFLLLILLAKYITPEQYGRLSLFNTIVMFVGYFIALSSNGYMTVSFFQKDRNHFKKDISSIYFITLVMTLLFLGVIIVCGEKLATLAQLPSTFLYIAIVICVFNIFHQLFMDFLRVQEKVAKYGIFSISFAVLNFALSLFLVINKGMDWEGRVYAHLVCTLLFGLIGIVLFFRRGLFTLHFSLKDIFPIILWGLPLIPHQGAIWLKSGCDRYIINGFHTLEDVGIFSFALNLMSIIVMIGTAFNSSNSVTIYQVLSSDKTSKEKKAELKHQTKVITMIYAVCITLIMIGVSALVPILIPRYSASVPYFWILAIAGTFQCFYFLFCNYLFYFNKNKNLMMITFISACIHLCLSLVLTRFSLFCTCVIYVISNGIVFYLVYRKSRRILKEKLC